MDYVREQQKQYYIKKDIIQEKQSKNYSENSDLIQKKAKIITIIIESLCETNRVNIILKKSEDIGEESRREAKLMQKIVI